MTGAVPQLCPRCGWPLEDCDVPPVQDEMDGGSFRGQVELK